MESSNLRGRILYEMEDLISSSCPKKNVSAQFKNLHIAILKKYYSACEVSIDYQRRRIKMEVIMDDADYNYKTMNINLPTLHANLFFRNLSDFLKLCIDSNPESLSFYKSILSSYSNLR